jgi:hypothetical protein
MLRLHFLRAPPVARLPFHQIGHPPGPLYLCPLEQVFQPALLASGMCPHPGIASDGGGTAHRASLTFYSPCPFNTMGEWLEVSRAVLSHRGT